jgi:uncharacterized membrane protein YjgN (DUF898 family)
MLLRNQMYDVSNIALDSIKIGVWYVVWAKVSVRRFLLGGIDLLHNA